MNISRCSMHFFLELKHFTPYSTPVPETDHKTCSKTQIFDEVEVVASGTPVKSKQTFTLCPEIGAKRFFKSRAVWVNGERLPSSFMGWRDSPSLS